MRLYFYLLFVSLPYVKKKGGGEGVTASTVKVTPLCVVQMEKMEKGKKSA